MRIALAGLSLLTDLHAQWRADWIWGCALTVLTVIIHVLGLAFISQRLVVSYSGINKHRHPIVGFAMVMGAATLLATILHGIEAAIWAGAYCSIGALPDLKSGMLFSLSAMTTYGPPNVSLEARWLLLGPIEALNGWLLFGLSAAFLFWMIQEFTLGQRPR